jgi:hypothetical protein
MSKPKVGDRVRIIIEGEVLDLDFNDGVILTDHNGYYLDTQGVVAIEVTVSSPEVSVVTKAIQELKLQRRLIKNAWTHDLTLYRAWVAAVIPSLIGILEVAESALEVCTHPEDIACWDEQVALAKAILGQP